MQIIIIYKIIEYPVPTEDFSFWFGLKGEKEQN
jgi:hypothetical protein